MPHRRVITYLSDLLVARCTTTQPERRVEDRRQCPNRRKDDHLPPESSLMPVYPPDDYHPALPPGEVERRTGERRHEPYTGVERRR